MARLRQQPPSEEPKPQGTRVSASKARTDADGLTWPPPMQGWHDADGIWHPGDPRRVLYEDWTPRPVDSMDIADAEDLAARDARIRHSAERQAATEQARPVRATPDRTPGRPIRISSRKDQR